MMLFKATPFTQNDLALTNPAAIFFPTPDNHRVGHINEYDERASIEVDGSNHEAVLVDVWAQFQNIDEDRVTPDDGRSLMTSDLVRLTDLNSSDETWWICCSRGWHKVEAPAEPGAKKPL